MQTNSHDVYRVKVDAAGRVVIPTATRQRFGIRHGDEVVIDVDDSGMHIKTLPQVIKEVQDYFTQFTSPGESLSDELLRERREEAERE